MTWNCKAKRHFAELDAMTEEERQSLTWEQAQEFIEPDTLHLAARLGMKAATDKTPYECLKRWRERRE